MTGMAGMRERKTGSAYSAYPIIYRNPDLLHNYWIVLRFGCDPPICRTARRSIFKPYHTPLRRLRHGNPELRFSQRKSQAA